MVSKKNLELLEKIADLCNQASEELEDTNEILCLCDELVEKIDALNEAHVEGATKIA